MNKSWLVCGDTHGDLDFAQKVIYMAKDHNADIIQVGDWGYAWPRSMQHGTLSLMLSRSKVRMFFLDGNHDYFEHLNEYAQDENGAAKMSDWLTYQSRGSVHEDEDGTRFLFMGGAPSIDRSYRTPGVSWWPEEKITEEQCQRAIARPGPFHVLFTHDAPELPPGIKPRPSDPVFHRAALASLEKVSRVVAHHRPPLLVHGHYHVRYQRMHEDTTGNTTTVVGLASNLNEFNSAVMLWSRDDSVENRWEKL